MTGPAGVQFRRCDERSRYEAVLSDEVIGVADFRDDGTTVVLPHVEVQPAHEGQGVAGGLTRFALDDLRAAGRRVVPICPYVVSWLRAHPEYGDLVATDY